VCPKYGEIVNFYNKTKKESKSSLCGLNCLLLLFLKTAKIFHQHKMRRLIAFHPQQLKTFLSTQIMNVGTYRNNFNARLYKIFKHNYIKENVVNTEKMYSQRVFFLNKAFFSHAPIFIIDIFQRYIFKYNSMSPQCNIV